MMITPILRTAWDASISPLARPAPLRQTLLDSSAASQAMQGNFRRTVEAHGDDARSRTDRGVAAHVVIPPSARPHSSRQDRFQLDRNRSRETKLTPMRMAAQVLIGVVVGVPA